MSRDKEIAKAQVRNANVASFFLDLLGCVVGYAISYWFQPELLRLKCPLSEYFIHILDVLSTKETAPTAIIVTTVVAAPFACFGKYIFSKAKLDAAAVLSDEELKQFADNRIVIGKIKEGEDNVAGSAKRIIRMLLIGLGIVFGILVLLIVGSIVYTGMTAK